MLGRLRALKLEVLSTKTALRSGLDKLEFESTLTPQNIDQAYAELMVQISTGRQTLERSHTT